MAYIKRPQAGEKALQSIHDSLISVIDYLPTLEVRGDNKSTYVEHSNAGTIVHVKQNANPDQAGGKTYYAGKGLTLSGNVFNNAHTSGRFIEITSGNQINCTLTGGDYIEITPAGQINFTGDPGGGSGSGVTYIGDGNTGSGHIFVKQSGSSPRLISSNLVMIDDLNNYDLTSSNHFIQLKDLKEGAGTEINYHYNTAGIHPDDPDSPVVTVVDGIEVDLNVSGGTYITTKFHNGVGHGDDDEAYINCNLSGDRQVNHPYGLITIVPQYDASYNITGGIISTILHAGSGIAIDPSTGEITATGGGEGGPDNDTTYTGGRFIYVEATGDNPHTISCTLSTLAELENTPGYVTSSYFYEGKNILLSTHYTQVPVAGNPNQRVEVADGIEIINLLSGGTYINVNDIDHSINCTLTGLDQLANTPGFITEVDIPTPCTYLAGSGLALSTDNQTFYLTANIPTSTSQLINDVPFLVSSDLDAYYKVSGYQAVGDHLNFNPHYGSNGRLDCTLTDGNLIHIDELEQINCTLTGLDQLANTNTNYITLAEVPAAIPHIPTSGLTSTALYDANNNLTGIEYGLSSKFYNDLTTISTRPATGDRILSSHNGTLSWQTNTASSPTWTSLTPSLLSINNSTHQLSAATQGGGSSGPGAPPNWGNTADVTLSLVESSTQTLSEAASGGYLHAYGEVQFNEVGIFRGAVNVSINGHVFPIVYLETPLTEQIDGYIHNGGSLVIPFNAGDTIVFNTMKKRYAGNDNWQDTSDIGISGTCYIYYT